MAVKKQILERLRQAVLDSSAEKAINVAKEALEAGIDPLKALEEGLAKGLREVGEKFERMEVFLPQLFLAAEAMEAGVKVLEPAIAKEKRSTVAKGTVVIGTVEGDIHDIGKNIVVTMLRASGFKVHDLGKDVPIIRFIETAEDVKADVIGLSSLMSTTQVRQRDAIEYAKALGVRDKYLIVVGGAPITKKWVTEIGADGWGTDASGAVRVIEELTKRKAKSR